MLGLRSFLVLNELKELCSELYGCKRKLVAFGDCEECPTNAVDAKNSVIINRNIEMKLGLGTNFIMNTSRNISNKCGSAQVKNVPNISS